jgi:hypothetical protein
MSSPVYSTESLDEAASSGVSPTDEPRLCADVPGGAGVWFAGLLQPGGHMNANTMRSPVYSTESLDEAVSIGVNPTDDNRACEFADVPGGAGVWFAGLL